ncbi:MAG: hypothetical protein ACYTBJ_06735 [Planctomycetota bacterium]|jgi:hypothetical protein
MADVEFQVMQPSASGVDVSKDVVVVTIDPKSDEGRQRMRLMVNQHFNPDPETPFDGDKFDFVCLSPKEHPPGERNIEDIALWMAAPDAPPPVEAPVVNMPQVSKDVFEMEIIAHGEIFQSMLDSVIKAAAEAGFCATKATDTTYRFSLAKVTPAP